MIAWPSLRVVGSLVTARTLAWASSYDLPAIFAVPMAHELQAPPAMIFAAFSVALVGSALLGPSAGKMIDRHGGRPELMGTNLVFALGLAALAQAAAPFVFGCLVDRWQAGRLGCRPGSAWGVHSQCY